MNFLDLFAGAGGLSEGFIQAGFTPVAHVESDAAACFTLRTRMSWHWLKGQNREDLYAAYLNGKLSRKDLYARVHKQVISSVINREISQDSLADIFQQIDFLSGGKKIDLIVGGPPCQAYSIVGRARTRNRMQSDKRNYLYQYYAKFLEKYQPAYFVFENVLGLLSARDENGDLYWDDMRETFHQCGYEVEYRTLCAEDFGVLQSRKRIILVGRRGKGTGFFPEPEKWFPKALVGEIFNDLPPLRAGEGTRGACQTSPCHSDSWLYQAGIRDDMLPLTWHLARKHTEQDLEIYRIAVKLWDKEGRRLDYNTLPDRLKTHHNQNTFLDRFKVVAKNVPFSQTVVAHIAKDGHYYIHPDIAQNRSLTPREAARLQTFPDNYYFEGRVPDSGYTPAFRQIGNAVPVLLARKIAEKLRETWS